MAAPPTRVLLATDGSEDASSAARAAVDLCGKTGGELHLIHAWRPAHFFPNAAVMPEAAARFYRSLEQEARDVLSGQVRCIEEAGGKVTRAHLRMGHPADEILAVGEEIGADLITTGGRGLNPLKQLLIGSVAAGVAHHADRPVMVVRRGDRVWPPARFVIGDDASEDARGAGELAVGIARLYRAEALLITVYPELPRLLQGGSIPEEELRRAEEVLQQRAAELENALGYRPRVRMAVGDVATVIMEAAREGGGSALVAIGRRGLGAGRRALLGGVFGTILQAATGPVLIYPHRHGE